MIFNQMYAICDGCGVRIDGGPGRCQKEAEAALFPAMYNQGWRISSDDRLLCAECLEEEGEGVKHGLPDEPDPGRE